MMVHVILKTFPLLPHSSQERQVWFLVFMSTGHNVRPVDGSLNLGLQTSNTACSCSQTCPIIGDINKQELLHCYKQRVPVADQMPWFLLEASMETRSLLQTLVKHGRLADETNFLSSAAVPHLHSARLKAELNQSRPDPVYATADISGPWVC